MGILFQGKKIASIRKKFPPRMFGRGRTMRGSPLQNSHQRLYEDEKR